MGDFPIKGAMEKYMFRVMDETEIEIRKIDKLRMVHIYRLTGAEAEGVGDGCTAMAVYYGNNQQINLNEMDPHFDYFMNRVLEVYEECEQKETVIMDENSRALLTAGVKTMEESGLEAYYKQQGSASAYVPLDSFLSKRFLPLAEYLLAGIYKTLGSALEITTKEYGWRGMGRLTGVVGEEKKEFRVWTTRINSWEYSLKISGFLGVQRALHVNIKTNELGVDLAYESPENDFYGSGFYSFEEDGMTETHEMMYQGRQVFYDSKKTPADAEELTEDEAILFPEAKGERKVYHLPWSSCFCVSVNREQKGFLLTEEYRCAYYYGDAGYVEINGWTKFHSGETKVTVCTKQFYLQRLRLRDNSQQTYFGEPTGSSIGIYREKLAGKYFILPLVEDKGDK